MLAKCANPQCSHVFRYFGTGKLYRLTDRQQHGKGANNLEHFWLCANCAPMMTIAVEPTGKPVVIPRAFVRGYREAVGRVSWVPEISPALFAQSEVPAQPRAV